MKKLFKALFSRENNKKRVVSEKELAVAVSGEGGLIPFGTVILPHRYESGNIFICGGPRVGKSVMLKQQIEALRRAGRRVAIHDFKGEYAELFYRPETDFILDPLDKRGSNWPLFSEIESMADLDDVCNSLIVDSTDDDRFWTGAAKATFKGILAGLYAKGEKTNADIWRACTSSIEDIVQLCESTPSGQAGLAYIQNTSGKTAERVIKLMMHYVSWLEFACDGNGPELSTIKFLESDSAFLFLTTRSEAESTIRPMTSLFIDLLFRRTCSRAVAGKTYVYLDEFEKLQKLPSINLFAAGAPHVGGVLAIAIHNFRSIQKTYGWGSADALFNTCGNTAILNVADPATAEYFSKRFGKHGYVRENYKMSSQDQGDGLTQSDLIMPEQIQNLPKLQCYLEIPGHNPALINLKTQLPPLYSLS